MKDTKVDVSTLGERVFELARKVSDPAIAEMEKEMVALQAKLAEKRAEVAKHSSALNALLKEQFLASGTGWPPYFALDMGEGKGLYWQNAVGPYHGLMIVPVEKKR